MEDFVNPPFPSKGRSASEALLKNASSAFMRVPDRRKATPSEMLRCKKLCCGLYLDLRVITYRVNPLYWPSRCSQSSPQPKCISQSFYERRPVMRKAINSLIQFIQDVRDAKLEVASQ